MGLIENDKVVWDHAGLAEPREHARARQRVDADDQAIALSANERVRVSGISAGNDLELKTEECGEFALPVPNETGGRNDEDALDEAAGFHLAQVKAGHNRLAGARVVRKQEPQRKLFEHVLVHRDSLMRQRVDLRNLGGEGRIEHVAKRQAFPLGQRLDDFGRTREIHCGRPGRRGHYKELRWLITTQLEDLLPGERRWLALAILPAVYRRE